MKKAMTISWLLILLSAMVALFWYNDWRYQLPTPVPKNYKPVSMGKLIRLNQQFNNNRKPVFLHFFNPDCPCSRFNIAQFKTLVREYSDEVDFMVVVLSPKSFTAKTIKDKFDLDIPVSFDPELAVSCGVYSTPQAALLDNQHHLYYRGNYNSSRYCTDEKTSYAKIALRSLLLKQTDMIFSPLALKSYGCSLPDCKNY
jgi:hypothetical protein